MRWKPTLVFLICCGWSLVFSASPQAARRGVSVIVVPTESNASELRSRIRSGASFESLAVLYSADSTSGRAGYMGMVDESSLKPELKLALEGLPAGAVSPVTRLGDSFALLKWTTTDEDLWRSQHEKAVAEYQVGRYPEAAALFLSAIQHIEKTGKQDIRLAESLNGLAQIYRYQQNHAEAETLSRQSLAILEQALGPSHNGVLPSLVNLAGVARVTGRYEEAEQFYRRILAVRWGAQGDVVLEKFAEVLTLAHTGDRDLEAALAGFWQSISASQLDKNLFIEMRDKLLALQLVPEAESLMLRAIRMNPGSRQLHYRLGELYETWGKYQKAIEAFQEAGRVGANADPAMERTQRGRIYERIGEMHFYLVQFDEALAAFRTSLEINPAASAPRVKLGALYLRRNMLEEAADQYRRAISSDPGIADAHEGLAQVCLALGLYQDAAQEADKALRIEPGLQSSRYIKAMALIRDGREEGKTALEDYQKREVDLEKERSRRADIAELERTASALLAEDRPDDAIKLLREGIQTHPLSAVLHLKLGLIQSRLQSHKEAVETFESMVRLKLDDFLVHRQLSREYEWLGNKEGGQQQRVLYLQRYDAALQSSLN